MLEGGKTGPALGKAAALTAALSLHYNGLCKKAGVIWPLSGRLARHSPGAEALIGPPKSRQPCGATRDAKIAPLQLQRGRGGRQQRDFDSPTQTSIGNCAECRTLDDCWSPTTVIAFPSTGAKTLSNINLPSLRERFRAVRKELGRWVVCRHDGRRDVRKR